VSDAVPSDDSDARAARLRVAAAAASSLGGQPIIVGGVRYRFDCSGVASGIYAKAGFPLGSDAIDGGGLDVRRLYELVKATGSLRKSDPLPGDLVFFDDTYDYNGNGQLDDPLSHVGVVERVVDDGTVIFVHRIGQQVVRARLNLRFPARRHDDKRQPLNHYLRSASGAWPAKTTGELFVAFGSLPVARPERLVATR
jgi:cell wall-associated NlpC family hydrolase